MSHFTKVASANIVDASAFIKAAAELGMTVVERNMTIRAWERSDSGLKVDVFCRYPGQRTDAAWRASSYGIGLVKNGSRYEMVSDWSLTRNYLPKAIQATLPQGFPAKDGPGGGAFRACEALRGLATQLTTKHTIVAQYARQGFVASVKTDASNNIVVTLTR
jgi:hypothetical protein